MKSDRAVRPLPLILLVLCSIALLLLVGYIIGINLIVRRQPVYTAALPDPTAVADTTETPSPTVLPSATPVPSFPTPADATPTPALQLNTFSDRFWTEGVLSGESVYRSPDLTIYYSRVYDTETFGRKETYFLAEIFASDVTQIKTASFKDDFSRMGHGDVEKMAKAHNALVAISGDYYGFHRDSLVIRNGEVYRKKLNGSDVCLLLRDGTMETIRGKNADIDEILRKDPWQAWQFGPVLMDEGGYARTNFADSMLNARNPRSCIGYVEPGHYFFVVVDGRQKNAKGLTLFELASLMESLGCVQAFNLDGGASAHFFWNGRVISNPSGGGREISDIIYLEKETYPVSPYYCGKDGLHK